MTNELRAALYACRAILVKLQQLSDAPTGQVRADGQLAHGTGAAGLRTRDSHGLGVKGDRFSTSKVPEGVRLNGAHTQAPSKQFSLWAHYSWRMERARAAEDASALLRLAACATRDYEVYMHIRPAYHESHEAAVTELLRDCVGVPAVEASWWLGAPEKWIRRQRVLNGRDAEMGESVRTDERTQKVLEMKRQGKTQGEIAATLGVSQPRVSQILAGR